MRRKRMRKAKSRKLFRKTAAKTHKRNMPRTLMRGGFRL